MKILSIGNKIQDNRFNIVNITLSQLDKVQELTQYDYILISGGDGLIRRTIKVLHSQSEEIPPLILNPIGSFNVIAKLHRVKNYKKILDTLANEESISLATHKYYSLNNEIFLFSAGNMGDLQHIFLAEGLRFGVLENNMGKYALSILLLLPFHLIMTPFMLLSSKKFFIFTPASFIPKFGSFYGKVEEMQIDLGNHYNHIELDGDIVTITESTLNINHEGSIDIVV